MQHCCPRSVGLNFLVLRLYGSLAGTAASMLYGAALFDPVQIVAQIVALQCLSYLSLSLLAYLLVGPYVPGITLAHLFDWHWVSFHSFQGWMVTVVGVANAFAVAVFLRLVVERAKKCLDFAATFYLINLVVVWSYSSFPSHIAWWLASATQLGIAAVLGEWLCMRRELQEIPLSSLRAGRKGGGGSVTELAGIGVRP